jgi:hypothetical protein
MMRRFARYPVGRALAAVVALAALALATPSFASRNPKPGERTAISRAVKHSRLTSAVPDYEYTVRGIRVSTKGPFAKGEIFGVGRYKNMVQPAFVLLKKSKGHWRLIDIGGDLSCRDAPRAVFRDLRLPCS